MINFFLSKVLIDARDKLKIPWEDSSRQSQADYIMTFDRYMSMDPSTFLQYVPHIRELWKDGGIHKAYDRRREFQLVSIYEDFYICFVIHTYSFLQFQLESDCKTQTSF